MSEFKSKQVVSDPGKVETAQNESGSKAADDEYFLFVGGSYNGQRLKLEEREPKELIQVPDQIQVGLNLDGDLERERLIHPQIYKYDYKEQYYVFVKDA